MASRYPPIKPRHDPSAASPISRSRAGARRLVAPDRFPKGVAPVASDGHRTGEVCPSAKAVSVLVGDPVQIARESRMGQRDVDWWMPWHCGATALVDDDVHATARHRRPIAQALHARIPRPDQPAPGTGHVAATAGNPTTAGSSGRGAGSSSRRPPRASRRRPRRSGRISTACGIQVRSRDAIRYCPMAEVSLDRSVRLVKRHTGDAHLDIEYTVKGIGHP